MQISADRYLDAPPQRVWAALNDVEVLRRSIPGCEKLEWLSEDVIGADVRARIGPIDTMFRGHLKLSDRDPPNAYRLTGEGQGAAAGFAAGSALIRLLPDAGGTRLHYDVDVTVGGKLAQIGSRLIDAAAVKFAEDFFERFARAIMPPPPTVAVAAEASVQAEPERKGLKPIYWVPMLIALVFLILFVFAGR